MNLDISSLPAPVSVRWIKVGPGFTYSDIGFHDQSTVNPSESGSYYVVAWSRDPAKPDWYGAMIWDDATQSFRRMNGGYEYDYAAGHYKPYVKGGVVGLFQGFTV